MEKRHSRSGQTLILSTALATWLSAWPARHTPPPLLKPTYCKPWYRSVSLFKFNTLFLAVGCEWYINSFFLLTVTGSVCFTGPAGWAWSTDSQSLWQHSSLVRPPHSCRWSPTPVYSPDQVCANRMPHNTVWDVIRHTLILLTLSFSHSQRSDYTGRACCFPTRLSRATSGKTCIWALCRMTISPSCIGVSMRRVMPLCGSCFSS